ncbi:MAG TPA: M14 family zinc carboxypeptidase [Gemmatimonadaceae bacterium]|nr:M14 family zinc carboxypeptidase [Gemmatimonadaceae bacterium]
MQTSRALIRRFLPFLFLAISSVAIAQTRGGAVGSADPASAKPGRDPNQPIDEEYTKKIREYTTESFFLSPLVDYLPASSTVPTPKAVLGDIAGARNNLPYSKDVYAYMRLLEKSTPRVRVFSIGKTEEGREMIAVAVGSENLMARLDSNKAKMAKLADPRSFGLDDAQAQKLLAEVFPVYYITGTIHSTESGAPTALMELAYRLAVDESPYIRNIRDHLVTLITPVTEVDGRDRAVDMFRWHMAHPNDTYPRLVYWGHYVAHDNNRDAMALTLKLSQNVLDTYLGFGAIVLHDLHESVPFLYDNTIGDGPYNAWLDPLLTNEWQMLGWNNVQEMTRLGMPGVFTHGTFDTWSPGYLMFLAATHNGISRLYETFGNGGTAETVDRTLTIQEASRTWYRQNPPLPRVTWSLRNNNNYQQTGLLVSLSYFANNRAQFLENFYEKSKRSITKPRNEGPAAYVFPGNDPRPGAQAELLRLLQKQHVEISRATVPFTVTVPAARARPPNTANADTAQARSTDTLANRPKVEAREFPTGTYVVRMDQPYSRIADALLDYQYWAPSDPQKSPYDDTGWTFPENFAVRSIRVTDPKVLAAPMQLVSGDVRAAGGINGSGNIYAIDNNAENALATLRYRLRKADFQIAEQAFDAAGKKFRRGSFIVRGVPANELQTATQELGLSAYAISAAPSVATHPARAPRVAILHTWTDTQTEGWWREAFDFNHIPYDYISVQDLAKNPNPAVKYDVIVFPPAGGSPQSIVDGLPMWRNPIPWKVSELTPNVTPFAQTDDIRPGLGWQGVENLKRFVDGGGLLITSENITELATAFGFANGVSVTNPPRLHVVGSLLRTKIVDDASPLAYGISDSLAVYSDHGMSYTITNVLGTRGGRPSDSLFARPTGRGTAEDVDAVIGRPELDPKFQLPPRKPVQPWQAPPVTDEQMRNPLSVIPPALRPRVVLRFADQRDLLVSGLLDGNDVAQRPVVVDVPSGKGHVVLFANNPMYRGSTIGSYFLVFNALLNYDKLDVGRKLDTR